MKVDGVYRPEVLSIDVHSMWVEAAGQYPATVTLDTELSEAAEIMLSLGARHLPVMDGEP